ncbi:MAG: hypothetical protein JST11_28980 [Acidobacteria bacterium]|nr:hypothetical protein [Acidobacteriota bacterium]
MARLNLSGLPDSAVVFAASLLAAIAFWLFGPYTNFGGPGYIDPWLYTGYFIHFSYLVNHGGVTYYVTRLPWIIPGILVFKIASAEAASVILNGLISACSISAVYLVVCRYYGRLAAAVAAIALMVNPYFAGAVSWDYPDGPAIAYALVALACFATSHRGRIPNAVWAGAALALSGYTNLAVMPVLLGTLMIPAWRNRRSPLGLLREAGYVFCGGAAVTLVLAIVSKLLLNTYLFFMPQIDTILYTLSHPDYLKNMWGTGNAWIPAAYRLFPSLFVLFLGGVFLLLRRKQVREVYVETYLCLAATCALFAVLEFHFHSVSLRVSYCSSYITAPVMLFAGILLGEVIAVPATEPEGRRAAGNWFRGLLLTAGLILPVVYGAIRQTLPSRMWTILSLGGLAAAGVVVVFHFRPRPGVRSALAVLILVCLFLGPAIDSSLSYVWSKQELPLYRTMLAIQTAVDSDLSPERDVRFWYESDIPATGLFDSAYSLYLWGYIDLSKSLATMPVTDLNSLISTNTTIVHLMLNQDQTAERTRLLAGRGIRVRYERRHTVRSPAGLIYVVLQDVSADSAIH